MSQSKSLNNHKKQLRQEVKCLKALMTEEELLRKSARVWERVNANLRFRQAKTVLLYWSMPDEVYTHDFIKRWSNEKTIILPVVDGEHLRLALFEGEQSLRLNAAFNLYEPQGNDYPSPQTIELSIVPGVAFDRNNNRLGRGRGYYDRLLPKLNSYNIGVCFDFQVFDVVFCDENDVAMDEIFSD